MCRNSERLRRDEKGARILKERIHVRPDRTRTRADPIRIHDVIPHHLPGDHHWPCELSRGTGRPVVVEERHHLSRPLSFLVAHLRRQLRNGRRFRHRHGLPVRHQLELLFGLRRIHYGAVAQLRGADRLLPRSRLPGRRAVRMEQGWARPALLRHDHGGDRDAHFGVLDSRLQ